MEKENNADVIEKRDCLEWEFDNRRFESTIAMEWDLICDDAYKLSLGQTVYFIGMTTGVFLSGVLSDRFGRKPMLILVVFEVAIFGSLTSIVNSFELFLFLRFLSAQGSIGALVLPMTYMVENVSGRWLTTLAGVGVEYFWIAGWLFLGLVAHEVVTWRNLVLATSLPAFGVLILIVCIVPESPKWLHAVGRNEDAEKVLREVAAKNEDTLDADWSLEVVFGPEEEKDASSSSPTPHRKTFFLDLFRYPQLRWKMFVLFANWFANSLIYYGLTLNSGTLVEDWYANFLINGLMEIPAYTITIFILVGVGRRYPCGLALLISGIALLSLMCVPKEEETAILVIAVIGKFFVTISFAVVYVYTAELLPTVLRSTGLGASCLVSRFGGMAASWIAMLAKVDAFLPTTIYGVSGVIAGSLALFLPETNGRKMPDSIEESERIKLRRFCPSTEENR